MNISIYFQAESDSLNPVESFFGAKTSLSNDLTDEKTQNDPINLIENEVQEEFQQVQMQF